MESTDEINGWYSKVCQEWMVLTGTIRRVKEGNGNDDMIWMTNPTWKSTQHKVIIYIYIYIYIIT